MTGSNGKPAEAIRQSARRTARVVTSPRAAAAGPVATFGAYLAAGVDGMMIATGAVVMLYAVATLIREPGRVPDERRDHLTGLFQRDDLVAGAEEFLQRRSTGQAAAIALRIDGFDRLAERFGRERADDVLTTVADRLGGCLREGDLLGRLQGATFAAILAPGRDVNLESALQTSARLQAALAEPLSVDGSRIRLSATLGFCLSARAAARTGHAILDGAEEALTEAKRRGEGEIGAFSAEVQRRNDERIALMDDLAKAISEDRIIPYFQPQISTETGAPLGFEALARWDHPKNGLIPPGVFLPAAEQAGLMEELGEKMLDNALRALRAWDRAGLRVPSVAVNFASDELSNPDLPERVRWALDGRDISPDRLTVEVVETVVATSGDVVSRNLAALSALGCRIDLDDFGTGQASISNIRRFSIDRLKIDRSFVTGADTDPEQRRMVSAIVTMAERLGLSVLAEGVETPGEHAVVAQLGCDAVQGFGISRPMPFDETVTWLTRHEGKLGHMPSVPLRAV